MILIFRLINLYFAVECANPKSPLVDDSLMKTNGNTTTPPTIIKAVYELPLNNDESSTYGTTFKEIYEDDSDERKKEKNVTIQNNFIKDKHENKEPEEKQKTGEENIPLFAKQPPKDSDCYIATIFGDLDKFTHELEDMNAKILYKYTKNLKGVSFCLHKADDMAKIQEKVGEMIQHLESETDYYAASVQIDPPNHMYYMMNYLNTLFTNWILNNNVMNYLPFKYIYKFFYTYYNYEFTGKNVMIYMLDTSVDVKHDELKGRIKNEFSNNMSCSTHGTSVALLLAGKKYGFAKDSLIRVLNVLDCEGKVKLSDILFALETIKRNTGNTAILYFGITGPKSEIFNSAVETMSRQRILIVTPAGNNRDLACNYSPGSSPSVINVGSLDTSARISKFSNFNNCVRIYSLGENIEIGSSLYSGVVSLNGTSYSAALVASALAIFLESNPYADFKAAWQFITDNSEMINGYLVQKIPKLSSYPKVEGNELKIQSETSAKSLPIYKIGGLILFVIIIFTIFVVYKRRKKHELTI